MRSGKLYENGEAAKISENWFGKDIVVSNLWKTRRIEADAVLQQDKSRVMLDHIKKACRLGRILLPNF